MDNRAVVFFVVLIVVAGALALRDLAREGVIWTWSEINEKLQALLDRMEGR